MLTDQNSRLSALTLFSLPLRNHFVCCPECLDTGRRTTVDRAVKQNILYFLDGTTISKTAENMSF